MVKGKNGLVVSRAGAGDNYSTYEKVVVSAEGLWQDRVVKDGLVSVCILKAKFRSGDSWDVADGGKRTAYGPEEIEVPAGKYTAVRVVWERGEEKVTSWYAVGVGEVKRMQERGGTKTVTRILKSFEAK